MERNCLVHPGNVGCAPEVCNGRHKPAPREACCLGTMLSHGRDRDGEVAGLCITMATHGRDSSTLHILHLKDEPWQINNHSRDGDRLRQSWAGRPLLQGWGQGCLCPALMRTQIFLCRCISPSALLGSFSPDEALSGALVSAQQLRDCVILN